MSRDAAKAPLDRRDDDPTKGFVTADDLKESIDVTWDEIDKIILASGDQFKRIDSLLGHLGDDLSHIGIGGGLQQTLDALTARVAALEAAGGAQPAEPVTPEGTLEVDKYSGTFTRVRDTSGLLSDGQPHWFQLGLATEPGPGGEVYPTVNDMPAGTGGAWFDNNGNLGSIVGQTGTPIALTTIKQWVKYGQASNTMHYYMLGTLDTSGEHPVLTISQVVNVS